MHYQIHINAPHYHGWNITPPSKLQAELTHNLPHITRIDRISTNRTTIWSNQQ